MGRTPLTCGQQDAGASPEDNTEQNMERGLRNTLSLYTVE